PYVLGGSESAATSPRTRASSSRAPRRVAVRFSLRLPAASSCWRIMEFSRRSVVISPVGSVVIRCLLVVRGSVVRGMLRVIRLRGRGLRARPGAGLAPQLPQPLGRCGALADRLLRDGRPEPGRHVPVAGGASARAAPALARALAAAQPACEAQGAGATARRAGGADG